MSTPPPMATILVANMFKASSIFRVGSPTRTHVPPRPATITSRRPSLTLLLRWAFGVVLGLNSDGRPKEHYQGGNCESESAFHESSVRALDEGCGA